MLFGFFYIGSVYLVSYGRAAPPAGLGIPRPVVLGGITAAALVMAGVCGVSAAPLAAAHGPIGIGVYLAGLGLLSTLCVLARETKDVAIDAAAVPAPA